jgi:hypothetical protein
MHICADTQHYLAQVQRLESGINVSQIRGMKKLHKSVMFEDE